MIDIKTISGEQLMAVPILQDAVIHEELMASDYIMLSWNSDKGDTLPIGTYIEHEGERYSLIEPYTPTMVSEIEYKYTPQFHSREALWNKQPACVYTYEEDGTTVKTREFDWSFVGSPADAMQIVRQAIRNETGEEWSVAISDSLPASIELSAQAASIQSVLSSIADLCETEYWTTKADNTIHLSKCERGEAVVLEVGVNVNVPTVMAGNVEYYTRYYALGSTRNITQSAGSVNGSVNKRLTLDPAVYPYGYKDVKGHFENGVFVSDLEQGEVFSKVVVFDDIYPSSELQITDARPRMKYRLEGGEMIRVGGTDENPVYDQYAIWYFKIKDFTFSDDLLIAGLPLSVHFKSGRLMGQEFELIYHDKAKTENAEGDVVPFNVDAGDYEIKFKESNNGTILPDYAYIIPQNDDKITLFNIEMPSEYTASARTTLLEALEKEIESDHKDSNSYEFESNPVAFYESETDVVLGQKVSFVSGDKVLDTRVLMVERRLDCPCKQKIRVGNNIIKGSSKELRDDVASLNQNVDVLAAFNDLSKSIQDSYGRNQALVNEAIALINSVWKLEGDNLVTDKQVIIKNNLIVNGDTASGGDGQNTVVGITGILVGNSIYKDLDSDGLIDLTKAFEGLSVDVDLSNYYTKQEVDNKIAGIDLSPYAKKTELEALQNEVNAIESMLGTDAKDTIDTWNEVVAFLDGYKDSDDLATILSSMNGKIDANTQGIATINNTLSPIKSWYDTLSGLIVNDNGNVRIKTNLIVEGDSASGGEGDVTTQGIVGIMVNGVTYKDTDSDGIIDLGTISGGGGLTSVSWADIKDRPTALSEFENDLSSSDIAQILGYTPVRPTTLNNFLPKTGGQLTGALQIFDHMIYDDGGAFSIDSMDTISLYAPNDIVIWSEEGQLYFNDKPVLTEHQSLTGYQPLITDLGTIRSGAALGATAVQPATLNTALSNGLATKQNTISDLATIRSGAALGATAVQPATLTSALAGYLPLSGGTLNGALTVNGAIAGASTIQANSIICGTTRLRVNATGSVTSFGFIDAVLYGSTNNRSTVHIGSCYGGSSTITNTAEYPSGVSMTAISMYRGSVGIGKRFSDSELDTAYKAGIMLTVAGNQIINGNLVVTGDISA